jgi:hypothetical protein
VGSERGALVSPRRLHRVAPEPSTLDDSLVDIALSTCAGRCTAVHGGWAIYTLSPLSPAPPHPPKGASTPAAAEGHAVRRPAPSPHLVFRAPSGFTSVLFCRVVYAHCHWRCPPLAWAGWLREMARARSRPEGGLKVDGARQTNGGWGGERLLTRDLYLKGRRPRF